MVRNYTRSISGRGYTRVRRRTYEDYLRYRGRNAGRPMSRAEWTRREQQQRVNAENRRINYERYELPNETSYEQNRYWAIRYAEHYGRDPTREQLASYRARQPNNRPTREYRPSGATYHSVRNTANTQVILDSAQRGVPGERGARGVQGERGLRGLPGTNGLDGNAHMFFIQAIPVSSGIAYNQFANMNWRIEGSSDFLASPYVRRSQGQSGNIHWNQWQSVTTSMLFKPGKYKVTFNGRRRQGAGFAFGFDIDHNGMIGGSYANPTQEAFAAPSGANDYVSISYVFTIRNNTNFFTLEQLPAVEGQWFQSNHSCPQLMFEKIGAVEPSGSDDTLRDYAGMPAPNAVVLLTGDFDWAVPGGSAPASGYHPSDHPDNGGNNEWAVVEQAANSGSNVLSWIHRVRRFI